MKKFLLALAGVLALSSLAHAEQLLQDTITMQLKVEDWVPTTTARVTVGIDATLDGGDAPKVRAAMQQAVAGLASDADWRFISFDHGTDQAGLETWHAKLEARLKEAAIGGLADKTRQASKPGLQLKLEQTEFTPSLAETEAVKAKLRSQIYAAANDEVKRLQAAEPERKFRLGGIDFEAPEMAMPMGRAMNATALVIRPGDSFAGGEAGGITMQQKVVLQGRVTLASVVPGP